MNSIEPITILNNGIYDIYYNDKNEYVILSENKNSDQEIKIILNRQILPFKKLKYVHGHSSIYILENQKYSNEIELFISNDKIKTKVNRYHTKHLPLPEEKNEIHYLLEWNNRKEYCC